jgi:hypothetical protein
VENSPGSKEARGSSLAQSSSKRRAREEDQRRAAPRHPRAPPRRCPAVASLRRHGRTWRRRRRRTTKTRGGGPLGGTPSISTAAGGGQRPGTAACLSIQFLTEDSSNRELGKTTRGGSRCGAFLSMRALDLTCQTFLGECCDGLTSTEC